MAFGQASSLRSLGVGSWVELLAWGLVAVSCVYLAVIVHYVIDPLSAGRWSAAAAVIGAASLALLVLVIPSFLVWVYRLHRDLGRLGSYPLSPRQALLRLIIPIYNVWGIWVVFRTLADALRKHPKAFDDFKDKNRTEQHQRKNEEDVHTDRIAEHSDPLAPVIHDE